MNSWRADKNREAVAEQHPASENEKDVLFWQDFFRPEFLKKEKKQHPQHSSSGYCFDGTGSEDEAAERS